MGPLTENEKNKVVYMAVELPLQLQELKFEEEHNMYDSITVSCRGFTGTLVNLGSDMSDNVHICYTLSIRDIENGVLHILDNVKPYEIKLVSGRVTMGG